MASIVVSEKAKGETGIVTSEGVERERCRRSFRWFLRHWKFKNRDTGEVIAMYPNLWPGQLAFLDAIEKYPWIFALKAGKLGFTELECAFDAWVAMFRHKNARVHIFSQNKGDAVDIFEWVKFGLVNLPDFLRIIPLHEKSIKGAFNIGGAGQDTTSSMKFRVGWSDDPNDIRAIVSYPAVENVAISQVSSHSHVDEFSHMAWAKKLWGSVSTTVADPGGSCHIVSRGAGEDKYSAELWNNAEAGIGKLKPVFAPYTQRPGRTPEWRLEQTGIMTALALSYFAPETAAEALMGEDESPYIPVERWDALTTEVPELDPRTPIVMALDAAISNDSFAIVAVSRDPKDVRDVLIRKIKVWRPENFPQHRINLDTIENWIRCIVKGSCAAEIPHPDNAKDPTCTYCKSERPEDHWPAYNVVQICYDPYQLEHMAQRLNNEYIAWVKPFEQGAERLVADAMLFHSAMNGRIHHNGDVDLRTHIGNCAAKIQSGDDSKMRIVKRIQTRKVDLAVATSMANKRIMDLNVV